MARGKFLNFNQASKNKTKFNMAPEIKKYTLINIKQQPIVKSKRTKAFAPVILQFYWHFCLIDLCNKWSKRSLVERLIVKNLELRH